MTATFFERLQASNPAPGDRRYVFVSYDQLSDAIGPLARAEPSTLGIVLIENAWKAGRRPYHKQKLALVLTNLRHFALEQAARGVHVRYEFGDAPYGEILRRVADSVGTMTMMRPAERELREDLAPLVDEGLLVEEEHAGWMTTAGDFDDSQKRQPPWRMDSFYRFVRRKTGILMEADGQPAGGAFSFDAENRKPWRGEPAAPEPCRFEVDPITAEVGQLVESRFSDHPGSLDLERIPATREDAERLWQHALEECMTSFGDYEDAMAASSRTLFHTCISPLLNICRLLPERVVADAAAAPAPLNSREGFVRQVLGWREFMRHVHERTDGLRRLPDGSPIEADHLDAALPLPRAWWGEPSGLRCLDEVVKSVWEEGYSHHITRLMVLSNIATLVGVDPRELSDWFWCAYVDAYDWVVEPNVLGMGTFALGPLFTTKPYVSGAAYIKKMSDYCGDCAFDPKKTCPLTPAYWEFIARNRERLAGNPRMAMPCRSLDKRKPEQRARDAAITRRLVDGLRRGELLTPDVFPN